MGFFVCNDEGFRKGILGTRLGILREEHELERTSTRTSCGVL